ncbi:MAG: hypothetical protein WAN60_15710 [Candidatus Sulfotelmatobacter sp.]
MSTDSKMPLSGAPLSSTPVHGESPAPIAPEIRSAVLDHADSSSSDRPPSSRDQSPLVPEPGLLPGLQLWLHRASVFLFVLISAVAGVLLIILPWTPEWTDNYLLLSYPSLRTLVSSGFFRGICTGLGLLDIWIGFWEALHYHEHR